MPLSLKARRASGTWCSGEGGKHFTETKEIRRWLAEVHRGSATSRARVIATFLAARSELPRACCQWEGVGRGWDDGRWDIHIGSDSDNPVRSMKSSRCSDGLVSWGREAPFYVRLRSYNGLPASARRAHTTKHMGTGVVVGLLRNDIRNWSRRTPGTLAASRSRNNARHSFV